MPDAITLDDLLAEARRDLRRLDPRATQDAAAAGDALVVDIRSDEQRARDGVVPGALVIQRNVLEWRCAPGSRWRDQGLAIAGDRRLVLMCDEGYQSSLAAATLQRLGLRDATDLDGGFQAWRAAGLPVVRSASRARSTTAEPRSTPMPDPNEEQSPAEAAEPQATADAKQAGKDRGGEKTPPEPGGGKPQVAG